MKCKKVKNMLPLFIGSDLSSRKMSLIRTHVERCSSCRMEYESYVKSRGVLNGWLQEKDMDWNETEWQNSVRRAVLPSARGRVSFAPWPFRNIWAYALMAAVAFVFSLFFILPVFRGNRAGMKFDYAALESSYSFGSFEKGKQDIVTMTIVSGETGTKIVWFFDKNFQLEE